MEGRFEAVREGQRPRESRRHPPGIAVGTPFRKILASSGAKTAGDGIP